MTTITTSNMFYLGNLAEVDVNESDFFSENASAILGTYSKPPIIEITNVDQDDNGAIRDDEDNPAGDFMNYDLGSGSTSVFLDSTTNYNAEVLLGDGSTISIVMIVVQTQNGDTFASDLNGNDELENQSIQSIELVSVAQNDFGGYLTSIGVNGAQVVCFAHNTLITTDQGLLPIQKLQTGTQILTLDHGFQPCVRLTSQHLTKPGKHAPIQFEKNALGPGIPIARALLSPQHRVLVSKNLSQTHDAPAEVLIAANKFTGVTNISKRLGFLPATFYHILMENHEIIQANGMWCESLLAAERTIHITGGASFTHHAARPIMEGKDAQKLLQQLASKSNPHPLQDISILDHGICAFAS